MVIKGYGPIKERAVSEWRAAVAELRRHATRERADAHA